MASLSQIHPQVTPLPLAEALADIEEWEVDPEGVVPDEQPLVTGVTVSTQDIEPGWIFVGVPGMNRHGASLAYAAKAAGAVALVTDEEGAALARPTGLPTAVVADPRRAAGLIAKRIFATDQRDLLLVGVTGTNGKTTTTYLTRAALKPLVGPMGLFGTLEVDTGVVRIFSERTTQEAPVVHRALAQTAQADLKGAVVEVSSHAISLDRIVGVRFSLVIFTNLQHDHLDFYGDMENYFAAKASLITPKWAEQAVVAVDDEYGRRLVSDPQVPMQAVQVLTNDAVDTGDVPLWRVKDIRPDPSIGGSSFTLVSPAGEHYEAACAMPGRVNVQDAALALVGAHALGASLEEAAQALVEAPPIPGRMQWIPHSPKKPSVIVDYAHTPEAIERLLVDMRPLAEGKLIAVFGTDGDRDASKRIPLAKIIAHHADVLWVTDENPRWEDAPSIRAELLEGVRAVRPDLTDVHEVTTCRRDAVREAILAAQPEDLVVLLGKGAEQYQDTRGIKHHYVEADVAAEVLRDLPLP